MRKKGLFGKKDHMYFCERKMYTEGDGESEEAIESHPLFDFSDKSVSDQ